jgi:N-acetylneuraminate synthase
MLVLLSAWQRGAVVLEKHFTHDKTLPGNDHYHAMDESDLRTLRRQVAFVRQLAGRSVKAPLESERVSRLNARRSIVVQAPIAAGTVIEAGMLTCKRPGTGVSPLHWDDVIGRTAARALEPDHLLQWEDLRPR